ncbi:MAG: energy transducer TonB [Alphaproteobacteria bacterium]|nr:energy transducer TonB [Alphaproteobacteria bacterium]
MRKFAILFLVVAFGREATADNQVGSVPPASSPVQACPMVVDLTGERPPVHEPISSQPAARYPISMLRAEREGVVRLLVLLGVDGAVLEANVLKSPHRDFGQAALAAVQKWRWAPYESDGKSACVRTEVEVRFELR